MNFAINRTIGNPLSLGCKWFWMQPSNQSRRLRICNKNNVSATIAQGDEHEWNKELNLRMIMCSLTSTKFLRRCILLWLAFLLTKSTPPITGSYSHTWPNTTMYLPRSALFITLKCVIVCPSNAMELQIKNTNETQLHPGVTLWRAELRTGF